MSPYREGPDAVLLQRVADLENEAARRSKELGEAYGEVGQLRAGRIFERAVLSLAVLIPVLLLVALITSAIYMNLTTSDVPTHCSINFFDSDRSDRDFRLIGVTPWHADAEYGQYRTIDEALSAAERLHCPVKIGERHE